MYVAKFEEAIYVLHCFQKKTETTTKHDKEMTASRYREVINERKLKNEH
jgi:phage-related protein